jgi:hypothetical protein
MRSRHTVAAIIVSAGFSAAAGPVLARPVDVPLHPSTPIVRATPTASPAPPARDAGGALRPAAPVATSARTPAPTPLVQAGDSGLGLQDVLLIAGGASLALLGAAYLGARFAGHTPRVRAH